MKRILKRTFTHKTSDGMRSNEKIRELKKIKKYNISETISSLTILESFSAT